MNREIKFRFWDEQQNRFIGHYIFDMQNVVDEDLHSLVTEITIEQFTGRKTTDGKDIYEGDLLGTFGEGIKYFKIVFEDSAFYVYNNYMRWGLLSRFFEIAPEFNLDVLVIGNIHENPELIK